MPRAAPASPSLRAAERVGRYELLLPIASGGMATVYLARARGHGGFERDVALKLTHAHLRDADGTFAAELIEEAKLAVRIRHANVVSVLDVGEDARGVFLVMEYIEGDTLGGLMRSAAAAGDPLPPQVGVKILVDALAGLHAAHELCDEAGNSAHVVHRDFSPQNILVGLDGVSRLADFGVAKAATRLGHTRTGLIKGKIAYMAPEQARDLPLDRRCDIWAAGVVAWEILAGRRLHARSNEAAILLDVVSKAPPSIRDVRPDVDPALDAVVARALSLDPADRWPSAEAFASALVAVAGHASLELAASSVAEYVRELAGDEVTERRTRVSAIRRQRAEGEDSPATVDGRGPDPALTAIESTDTTSVSGQRRATSSRRLARAAFVGIAAALAGGVVFFVAWWVGSSSPRPRADVAPAPPVVAAASGASTAAPPADAPQPGNGAGELVVTANAPIASLQLGARLVPLPEPIASVTVPIDAAERSAPLRLAARSADGRRATVSIAPGDREAALVFATSTSPAPATKASSRGRLAKNPYEGGE